MKKLYWRPQRLSLRLLVLIAVVAIGALAGVETLRVREKQSSYREKTSAARLALRAFRTIKDARVRLGLRINPEVDPTRSGLIGELLSPVTTNTGHLQAKQTSINPNFAAVVVDMLLKLEVKPGDRVAVGFSGSFPALNITVLAALEALKLKPVIITSTGASQWGANLVRFMWPDMERVLREARVFSHGSIAASLGGINDRALGLSKQGRRMIEDSIKRSGIALLEVRDYDESLTKRMDLYREQAGDTEYKAYINVGGGTTSVGTRIGRDLFSPGLNRRPPRGPQIDSVMLRFAQRGVPVIHLSRVAKLAERHGLQALPQTMPPIGEGLVFVRETYNRPLTAGALALLCGLLIAFLRLDWGHRLLAAKGAPQEPSRPEPMV